MENEVRIDPFSYKTLDVVTTLVQIATAVAGIVLAINGNTAALLALGSLAGGAKGNLVGDVIKLIAGGNSGDGKPPTSTIKNTSTMNTTLPILAFLLIFMVGCTSVNKQFLIDSQHAITAEAGDYLTGCKQVTVAPAFSVDWDEKVNYGGGVFAGCEENGRLMEFKCVGLLDDTTQKTRIKCDALSLWERKDKKSE